MSKLTKEQAEQRYQEAMFALKTANAFRDKWGTSVYQAILDDAEKAGV